MENLVIERQIQGEILVQEMKPLLKQPSMFQVIMHNDDFTPMEFVVEVLQMYFHMEVSKATQTMYEVHMSGKAACGVYSRDIAETRVEQVMDYARGHQHPLLLSVEAV